MLSPLPCRVRVRSCAELMGFQDGDILGHNSLFLATVCILAVAVYVVVFGWGQNADIPQRRRQRRRRARLPRLMSEARSKLDEKRVRDSNVGDKETPTAISLSAALDDDQVIEQFLKGVATNCAKPEEFYIGSPVCEAQVTKMSIGDEHPVVDEPECPKVTCIDRSKFNINDDRDDEVDLDSCRDERSTPHIPADLLKFSECLVDKFGTPQEAARQFKKGVGLICDVSGSYMDEAVGFLQQFPEQDRMTLLSLLAPVLPPIFCESKLLFWSAVPDPDVEPSVSDDSVEDWSASDDESAESHSDDAVPSGVRAVPLDAHFPSALTWEVLYGIMKDCLNSAGLLRLELFSEYRHPVSYWAEPGRGGREAEKEWTPLVSLLQD